MAKGTGKAKKPMPPAQRTGATKPFVDPRTLLPAHETSGDRISWRYRHVDEDGPWGLSKLDAGELAVLRKCMSDFESMTMHELFNNGEEPGKDYEVPRIPNPAALARLEAIKLADMTRISRLRIGGRGRLYGFRVGPVFHIVWWDPQHEIWPTQKRNT